MRSRLFTTINTAGQSATQVYGRIRAMVELFYDAVVAFFEVARKGTDSFQRQIVSQILFTGVEAFWMIGAVAFVCGVTVVIQALANMPKFGVSEYFGKILVAVIVRELGPFFTSIIIIGRSGSALAVYIANMKTTREVAALEMMGINPVQFLVMPAFVGMIVSMVGLSVYFDLIGILGGITIASLTVNQPFDIFFGKVIEALTPIDIFLSIGKNILFGGFIAIISSYYGLCASNIREVPRAARKAVVSSLMITMSINVCATILYYFYVQ